MRQTRAQAKATQKYERKAYDKIVLRIRKDTEPTKKTIAAAADRNGMSMNKFILTAAQEKIEREGLT